MKVLARFWRAGVSRFGFESGPLHQWPCGCGAEVLFFRVFRSSSFDTVFANLKRDLLKLPSLLFVFCFLLRFLLGFGVNATLHVCFGAVGP